jgi:hypothetical protein
MRLQQTVPAQSVDLADGGKKEKEEKTTNNERQKQLYHAACYIGA